MDAQGKEQLYFRDEITFRLLASDTALRSA